MAVRVLLVVAALALLAPELARAGTYDVVTCESGGGLYANLAWASAGSPAGDGRFPTDATCAAAEEGWAMAELVAKGTPGPLSADFGLERFREGRFIDESVAAGVAH